MKGRIDSLQIIRAFAAILVVICHIWNDGWLSPAVVELGSFGVDLFFVLSGFIMCLTVKLSGRSKEANAGHFLLKRIVRIFPIYVICAVPLLVFNIKAEGLKDAFFYIGNIFLLPSFTENLDYRLVLGPGWTLVYEMLFYYIFAMFMLLSDRKKILLPLIAVCLTFIVFIFRIFDLQGPQRGWVNASYILGDTLLINFVLGIVCFFIYEALRDKIKLHVSSSLLVLLVMCTLAAYLYTVCGLPRLFAYGLPAFVSVSLFTLTQMGAIENKSMKILIFTGDASYSIYLTHYYFAFFKPKLVNKSSFFNVDFSIFLNLLDISLVVGAVVGGCLFYRWIEKPIITYSSKGFSLKTKKIG